MSVVGGIRRGSADHDVHRSYFLRHLLEMALAMMVGMMVSAAVFLGSVGMTVDEALRHHAVLFVVVQAFGMTVAMIAWMRHRGHAWRRSRAGHGRSFVSAPRPESTGLTGAGHRPVLAGTDARGKDAVSTGGGIANVGFDTAAGTVTLDHTDVSSNNPDNCLPSGSIAGCTG